MASFVEQATLKVNDQSSRKLNQLNRNLTKLVSTANRAKTALGGMRAPSSNFSPATRSADTFIRRLTTIQNMLNGIKATAGSIRMRPPGAVPTGQPRQTQQPARRRGNAIVGFGFGGIGLGMGGFGLGGGLGTVAGLHAGRAAGQETFALQAERTTQRTLGFTEDQIRSLGEAAQRAGDGMLGVTHGQLLSASRNLATAGVAEENLDKFAATVAKGTAAITPMLGVEQAQRTNEQIIKFADLAGALDDPKRGNELLQAGFAVQLVGGADFKWNSFLAALRTSGQAMTLSAEGLVNFAAAQEEQGRQAGSRLNRFQKVLFGNAGVSDKQINMLEASGIRKLARDNQKLAQENYGKFIRDFLVPSLEAQGVDVDDAVQVKNAVRELGFVTQEAALVEAEILKRDERVRNDEIALRAQFNKDIEFARKDFGKALGMLGKQFTNLSSKVLDPIFTALAPGTVGFAQALNELASGRFTASSIGAITAGGALGLTALAANNPGAAAMVFAGAKLRGAGNRLIAAAHALTTSARAGLAGGTTRTGRRVGLKGVLGIGAGFTAFDVIGDLMSGKSLTEAVSGRWPQLIGSTIGAGIGAYLGGWLGMPLIGATIGASIGNTLGAHAGEIGAEMGLSFASVIPQAWRDSIPPKWVSDLLSWAGVSGGQDELSQTPRTPTPRPEMPWDVLARPDNVHATMATSEQLNTELRLNEQIRDARREYNELRDLPSDAVAGRRADLHVRIQELEAQLAAEKNRRLPAGADALRPTSGDEARRNRQRDAEFFANAADGSSMQNWLNQYREAGDRVAIEVDTSLTNGAGKVNDAMINSSVTAGQTIYDNIIAAGTAVGAELRAALANAAVDVRVQSTAPAAPVDTGAQVPN